MAKNIIGEYVDEIYRLFDRSYKEGWMWYALGLLILIFVVIMLFS